MPLASVKAVFNRETKETSYEEVTLARDEGNRATTRLEGLQSLEPVFKDGAFVREGRFITAGNASQLSDGASACVIMDGKMAQQQGLQPLGIYRGLAVAGRAAGLFEIAGYFSPAKSRN